MSNESKRAEFNKEWGYACIPHHLDVAVGYLYTLGDIGYIVLSLIVKMYTRNVAMDKACEKDVTVYYSYEDIMKRTRRSKNGVIKAIKILLDEELIICTNNNVRSGRGKLGYIPNLEKLNEIMEKYYEKFPEDKPCNIPL